ncbi:HAD family hydrolase [Oceanispirochaeta sp. M1]|nr:HAD family hydrolase [Oceanispirochaeta sp. M1]
MLPDNRFNLKIMFMNNVLNSSQVKVSDALSFIQSREELFSSMTPIPTELGSCLGFNADIKAVLFDIYGTLLISEAGDIGLTALDQKNEKRNFSLESKTESMDLSFDEIRSCLTDIIRRHQQYILNASNEITYPEVDIISVWSELFQEKNLQDFDIGHISRAALYFEILSNKVDLMPGVSELFEYLRESGLILGIVSNAQFYTPLLMEYLCSMSLEKLGITETFTSWSYKMGCGKPDPLIFRTPVEALNKEGIQNHEILYIGNDMLNDISCAASLGLKTVLFAGDKRSLRLREDDSRVKGSADYIITDLMQLKQILQDGGND